MKTPYLKDLFDRLRLARFWVAAQFVGTALLILLGLAWARLPDKHGWQVALTLLIAESKPRDKDVLVKVLVNLINRGNV